MHEENAIAEKLGRAGYYLFLADTIVDAVNNWIQETAQWKTIVNNVSRTEEGHWILKLKRYPLVFLSWSLATLAIFFFSFLLLCKTAWIA